MKKRSLIIILILVALLGAYFLFGRGKNIQTTTSQNGGLGQNTIESGKKSLKELLALGLSQKCTYKTQDVNGLSEGMYYFSPDGKMRGEFSYTAGGKTTKSNMLVMNNTSYIWTEGEKEGFKMTYEPSTDSVDADLPQSGAASGALDSNTSYDFDCNPEVFTGGVFEVPANVKFSSFEDMGIPNLQNLPSVPTVDEP